MDDEGLAYFKEVLKRSSCYLEFGCGGSTVYASDQKNVNQIISVDTDINWIKRIRHETASRTVGLYLEHIDVGEVGKWGVPKSAERIQDFWKYPVTPWKPDFDSLTPKTAIFDPF